MTQGQAQLKTAHGNY